MLTPSTVFDTYASVSGHQRDVILKITQGSDTFYFSTRPMPRGITGTGPIYPMLLDHGPITESIDIFTKKWRVSDMTITLSEEPFYPDDGGQAIRASEVLKNLNGETCALYQWVAGITDIDDCLKVFDGYILQSVEVTKRHVRFTANDRSKLWEVTLPDRVISDEWADAPASTATLPIPWCYGVWNVPDVYNQSTDATGLLRATAYEDGVDSKYVVADHPVNAGMTPYRNTGGPTVLPAYKLNEDEDDSGIAWVKPSQYLHLDFYPRVDLPGVYNDETYVENGTQRGYLADQNISTSCTFRDRYADDGNHAEGLALWGIENEAVFRAHLNNGGRIKAGYRYIEADGDFPEGEVTQLSFYLYYGVDGGSDERIECGRADKVGSSGASILAWENSLWKYPGDDTYDVNSGDVTTDNDGDEWAFGVYWKAGVIAGAQDGTPNNQDIASMADAMIRYYYTVTAIQSHVWVVAAGKDYGTTYTSGRSNGYTATQTMQDPAIIIEDLYREGVGLTNSDIDTDSFDNACNSSVQARLNLTTRNKLSNIVRALSEQSTFVVAASGAGKLRCIALNEWDPTIAATIHRNQLVDDDFVMTKTSFIVNDMEVRSRYQPEYDRYRDVDTYTDSPSQSSLQIRSAYYDWPNILGDSAQHVAEHYVNSTDGLWSHEHLQVTFTTGGFTHSHLQPGDWIQLHSDIDSLRTAEGATWADRNLLVVETQKGIDNTTIVAVELDITPVSEEPSASASPSPSEFPSSPSSSSPWGRYDQSTTVSPITLPWLASMTDGNTSTEVGSDSGYMASSDHYALQFETATELDSFGTFAISLDRTASSLVYGAVDVYYSDDNNTWTKIGTTRTYTNGGMSAIGTSMLINGDGLSGESHKYWKFWILEAPGDSSGTLGMTELSANTV